MKPESKARLSACVTQLNTPRVTSTKLINDFSVDWYVLMHVKQSQTRETFIAHTRPKASFDALEPTKRPFCTTRGYRESTENCYKSLDIWVELMISPGSRGPAV